MTAPTDFENLATPLAERVMDYAMKKGKSAGITDVRVDVATQDNKSYALDKGELKVKSGVSTNTRVMLYAGKRQFTFRSTSFDEKALQHAIDDSLGVIGLLPESPHGHLLEPSLVYKGDYTGLDLIDKNPPSRAQLIDYLREIETGVFSVAQIKATRNIAVSSDAGQALSLATNGLRRYSIGTRFSGGAAAIAEDKSGMQSDSDYSLAIHFSDLSDPRAMGVSAARQAVARLGAALPPTAQDVPVILSPKAAVSFFSAVLKAIDGSAVHANETFLGGKLGEQVLNAGVTIVDNPRIVRGLRSTFADMAGMESKPLSYIEQGVLKTYSVSLDESRRLGVPAIGRDTGPTNIFVLPGSAAPEDLMRDINDGIYVKSFEGGKVDINDGTHSRQAYGARIIGGKVTDIPVEGFVLAGNLKEMFMRLTLANDTPSLPNGRDSAAAPTTRIEGITIAGR